VCLTLWAGHAISDEPPAACERVQDSGVPVPAGARLSLVLDQQKYFLGENLLVHFCVENVGPVPFSINLGGDYRGASRHLRFSVLATDASGQTVADPDPSGFCMGGISHSPTLKPGAKHYQTLALQRYCRFEKAGTYHLRV
jgi:hypothetical protein